MEKITKDKTQIFSLDRAPKGAVLWIENVAGEQEFISRASGSGFTPGTRVSVLQNYKVGPLIVYLRDTQMALGRSEAKKIVVKARQP